MKQAIVTSSDRPVRNVNHENALSIEGFIELLKQYSASQKSLSLEDQSKTTQTLEPVDPVHDQAFCVKSVIHSGISSHLPILSFDSIDAEELNHYGTEWNKIIFATGVNILGTRQMIGCWVCNTKKTNPWAMITDDLKKRGLKDHRLVFHWDNSPEFVSAFQELSPSSAHVTSSNDMVREIFKYVSDLDYRVILKELRNIYEYGTYEKAEVELFKLNQKWEPKYSAISDIIVKLLERMKGQFLFPQAIRRIAVWNRRQENVYHLVKNMVYSCSETANPDRLASYLEMQFASNPVVWKAPIHNWKPVLNFLHTRRSV